MQNHKWSKPFEHDYFKHSKTWWQKCNNCGLYRIHLMSIAHYVKNGKGKIKTKRPLCK